MGVVASFHLVRYPAALVPVELIRLLTQRRSLRRTDGLDFFRVLGTGGGSSMGLSADLRRWALFAVWRDRDALDEFVAHSPIARHWRRVGREAYGVALQPLANHGSWGGRTPLPPSTDRGDDGGAVAILTRASVRLRRLRRFLHAVAPVEAVLADRPGVLARVGIGESPIGRQATFSLWASTHDVDAFAYRHRAHRDVIHRTRRDGWYGEELFARFRPVDSWGTWDGIDPLSGRTASASGDGPR